MKLALSAFCLGIPLALASCRHPAPPGDFIERTRETHAWADENVPSGAAIFLGDSITQGLAVSAVAPLAVNYGIRSQTAAQLASAMPVYRSIGRAKFVFLEIGVNDLATSKGPDLEANFSRIAGAIPRTVTLVWTAIMPCAGVGQAEIDRANTAAARICRERGTCVFLVTPLTSQMFRADGCHLTSEGYAEWINALRQSIHY